MSTMKKSLLGLAAMAAMFDAGNINPSLNELDLGHRCGSTMKSSAILTNRQKKVRAKNKAARIARRINRV